MAFTCDPQAQSRITSATQLIKILLRNDTPGVLRKHIDGLIDELLWKITEANGKHNTRYRSVAALDCHDKKLLHHEHVNPKKPMIADLRNAKTEGEIDRILSSAVACTVLRTEHPALHSHRDAKGWDRYKSAGIAVMDLETGQRVV